MLYQENIAPSNSPQKNETRLKLYKNNRLESAVRFRQSNLMCSFTRVLYGFVYNQELKRRRIDVSAELRKVRKGI